MPTLSGIFTDVSFFAQSLTMFARLSTGRSYPQLQGSLECGKKLRQRQQNSTEIYSEH